MKTNFLIITLIVVVFLAFTQNCSKQDDSLSENIEQFSEEESLDLFQFITQNFGNYQNYLEMGGIPVYLLSDIINETITKTKTNEQSNTYANCITKYFDDTEKFHECLNGFDPSGLTEPGEIPSTGPPIPGDERIMYALDYKNLLFYFEPRTEEYIKIMGIDYNIESNVKAIHEIFKKKFPSVFKIAEEYYKDPKITTVNPLGTSSHLDADYWVDYNSESKTLNIRKLKADFFYQVSFVLFGEPDCFSEMLAVAIELGLERDLYSGASVCDNYHPFLGLSYNLLKNIAEKGSAFPVVYLPIFFDESLIEYAYIGDLSIIEDSINQAHIDSVPIME